VNSYSDTLAVRWHWNTSGPNRPINRNYWWTFHSTIFCLCST